MTSPLARFIPHLGRLGRATRWRRGRGARPRVWAHRGASALAPENTMRAFELAVSGGADGLEFDVRLDSEGNVIVFHDDTLDRLVGRPGAIADLSAAERAALRVRGEPIPLLAEVLDAFELELDIEIKSERVGRADDVVAGVAKVLAGSRRLDRMMVSSFDPVVLLQLHHRIPEIALAYIFHQDQTLVARTGLVGRAIGASLVHPQHTLCTAKRVKTWHTAGLPINAWTVDDPAELRRLAEIGVDGVFSNDPAAAIAVLSS
ncbi:MAG: glycerophosphodiester phosphodiesterase [Deltaproteobacteria bacterium]|nr:glycerophosphodiester phosphodiesterase [Deltaproteobacteria bacterium]